MSKTLRKVYEATIFIFFGKIGAQIFGVLTTIYLIRVLTVEQYGVYNILLTIVSTVLVVNFGIPRVFERYSPEFQEAKNWDLLKKLILWGVIIRTSTVLFFVFILYVLKSVAVSSLGLPEEIFSYFIIFGSIILFTTESQLLRVLLASQLEQKFQYVFSLISSFLKLALFYFFLSRGYGLIGVIWAWAIVEAVTFCLFLSRNLFLLLPKILHQKNENQFPFQRIFKYGLLSSIGNTGEKILDFTVDNYFLAYYLGSLHVGLYSFAAKISMLAFNLGLGNSLSGVFTPIIIRQYTKNKDEEQLKYGFQLFTKVRFFFDVPVLLGIALLSDKIILYLFKPEYLKIKMILYIWLVIVFFHILNNALEPMIRVTEHIEITTYSMGFAGMNIVLDILLIPLLGILGAVLATGLSQIASFFFQLFFLKRYVKVTFPWVFAFKASLNLLGMSLVVFFLSPLITGLGSLLLVSVAGALSYFFLALFNKCFDQADRDLLNRAIGRRMFVF